MQFMGKQLIQFFRFLRGEKVHSSRDQFIWVGKILGLIVVFGLVLSSLVFWAARMGVSTSGPPLSNQVATPQSEASPTSTLVPNAPIKGLTDEPSYRWWRWPNAPQPDSWWATIQHPPALQKQVDLMHVLGAKLFRLELPWPFVAPTMPGGSSYDSALARDPNWSGYQWQTWDTIVQLAATAGIQLVPQVVYSPDWASGIRVTTSGGPNSPPHAAQYYGDFLFAAATRYKGQIHYWELWNEPDLAAHTWNGTMQQYVDLILKPGYQSIKQVDPTAKVLLGGLASSTSIATIYTAGAKPFFDIVSFHAYASTAADEEAALDDIRQVVSAQGDEQKPIWLTEFGLKTQPDGAPGNPGTISTPNDEVAQAQLIHDVYGQLKIQAIFFYQLHDTAVTESGGAILKVEYFGLLSRDYSHRKPGFDAYKEAVGGVLPRFADNTSGAGRYSAINCQKADRPPSCSLMLCQ